jgi:hypothetical protein
MRTTTLALLLACLMSFSVASVSQMPNWKAAVARQSAPAKSSPTVAKTAATSPAPAPAATAQAPMQQMMVSFPVMLLTLLDKFTDNSALFQAIAMITAHFDSKHAAKGISKFVGSLSFLGFLSYDKFVSVKGIVLDKISFGLGGIKQVISQFASSQGYSKGSMTENQKSLTSSIERIVWILDLMIGKIAEIKKESIVQDKVIKDELTQNGVSQDRRMLKALKQAMN